MCTEVMPQLLNYKGNFKGLRLWLCGMANANKLVSLKGRKMRDDYSDSVVAFTINCAVCVVLAESEEQ